MSEASTTAEILVWLFEYIMFEVLIFSRNFQLLAFCFDAAKLGGCWRGGVNISFIMSQICCMKHN